MKIVLFAGGSGTRFWPIGRNNFPKQFVPIIEGKATLDMFIDNLSPIYGINNIFIPTTELLSGIIKSKFAKLPLRNIITEPTRRDVGPAVGLAMIKLKKLGDENEPIAILWGDGYTAKKENFLAVLDQAEDLIKRNPNQIIYIGEKPQYPNENIGWIGRGDLIDESVAKKQFPYF